MVASLQKQTDSMDVRAIEVIVRKGDTVVDINGVTQTVGENPIIYRAMDLPAGSVVLSAQVIGRVGAAAIGVGVTSSGLDLSVAGALMVADTAAAGISVPLVQNYYPVTTPLYMKLDDFSAGEESAFIVTYVLCGSSEYNI